jgi:hypothetical protein
MCNLSPEFPGVPEIPNTSLCGRPTADGHGNARIKNQRPDPILAQAVNQAINNRGNKKRMSIA